jgi:sulfate-transporting ATPase
VHLNVQLVLASCGAGGALALLTCGLVAIFRGSGILNFSHGAIATLASYTYLWLHITQGWPLIPAMVAGVAMASAVGGLFQLLVMWPLRAAPTLTQVIATLGLMIAIQGSIIPLFGETFPVTPKLFGNGNYELPFGSPHFSLARDRVAIFLVSLVFTAALWAFYRFTRFGVLTTASSENENAVELAGWSVRRLQMLNWVIGSAVAGLAGVLLSSMVPISPTFFTLTLIASIAAAVVGRLRDFWPTFLAAMLISSAQPLLERYSTELKHVTGLRGWSDAFPMLVIIIVVVLRGRAVPIRDMGRSLRLPAVDMPDRPMRAVLIASVPAVTAVLFFSTGWVSAVTLSLIGALICLSLIVVIGLVGQISLAQLGLAGFGAFISSYVAAEHGWPFPMPLLAACAATVALGLVVSLPALRVRGIDLAVVTLALAVALQSTVFNDSKLTGGDAGRQVASPSIGPFNLDPVNHVRSFALFVLILTAACFLGVGLLARSHLGRRLVAVRGNERAAVALGISVRNAKLAAFAISSCIGGLAGALSAYQTLRVSYTRFDAFASIAFVGVAGAGGIASLLGAAIAGLLATGGVATYFLDRVWSSHWQASITGVGLMVTMVLNQNGIAPELKRAIASFRRRGRRPPDSAEPTGDRVDAASPGAELTAQK